MKIIYNRYIPFGNFAAINLFGVLFVKHGVNTDSRLLLHESIHSAQIKELLWIPFYLIYIIEWFCKLFVHHGAYNAYRAISFEREAYANDQDPSYLSNRQRFAWLSYMFRL